MDEPRQEAELERAIGARGRELLAALRAGGGDGRRRDALTDRLTRWAMADAALKTQLFRFIDVLPALRSSEEIARHAREYLLRPGLPLPPGMAAALRASAHSRALAALVARTARAATQQMARRFIAGANAHEALQTIRRLHQAGLAYTVDILGEAVTSEAEAQAYQARYLELLAALGTAAAARESGAGAGHPGESLPPPPPRFEDSPPVNVSLKLSALYSRFDPLDAEGTVAAVKERLRPLMAEARRLGAYLHVDMEQYAYKDVTLRIFREVLMEPELRDWPHTGIVIQAYLRDAERDLHDLAAWARARGTPVWVRLVKGAYWDYETVIAAQHGWPVPVFTHKWETDANFERLTGYLLAHREWLRPAIASHNVRSVAHALALAEQLGLPPGGVEYQVLYGMGDRLGEALARQGERVRVYVPYGELLPGMAYLVRRLLENTSNESFLRHSLVENQPAETLLRNPAAVAPQGRPREEGRGGGRRRAQRVIPGTPLAGRAGGAAPAAAPPRQERRPRAPREAFVNEPETDFARAENRERLREALGRVRGQFGRDYPLVVDGRRVRTERTLARPNPSRHAEVVGRVCLAGPAEVEAAVVAAREAFPRWRDTPARERSALLFRAADVLRRQRFELAAWEILEVGKPWREADADVAEAIDFLEYYGREMERLAPARRRDLPGERNEYFYEGRGVAAVIAPWNFPLAILTGMTAAALVAGNTVVMKPAEQSSGVAYRLMEAFQEAGVPPGVLHYLPGRGEEAGAALVTHPDVSLIAFTGSKEVGLALQLEAARVRPGQRDIKRVVAELGGKNAILIDSDADLDEAVPGVIASGFGFQGQKCSACSRVIVLEDCYDAFVSRLVEAVRSLRVGPAEDPGTAVGPLVDAEARDRVQRYLSLGREEGTLLAQVDPGPWANEGYFVAPTLFADVSPQACLAQEEIFGPVLAVMKARDFTEALQVANSTLYALTGGLYSRSPAHIARARREFHAGNLYINRKITGARVDLQPFGGYRLSGIGSKAGGPDYLTQFLVPRTLTESTLRRGFAAEEG